MHDESLLVLARFYFPQFLDADAIGLGSTPSRSRNRSNKVLVRGAAAAFGEQRVLGVELHAGLELRFAAAVPGDPHVAGGDAFDVAPIVVDHLGRRESGEDLDSHLLRLAGQPSAQGYPG